MQYVTFAEEARATLAAYAFILPAPVKALIASAAGHIDQLEGRVARLERELANRATFDGEQR